MIRINDNQLQTTLEKNSVLCYFFTIGNDPYLQYVTQDQIKKKLSSQGIAEQIIFTIDNQTDWDQIYQSSQALSLFSNQILLILQFGETALTTTISKKLDELTDNLSPDIRLLISLTKLTKAQENTSWFKALSELSIVVNCNAPDLQQLPLWVNQQLQRLSLTIEKQGIDLLCYYYEGNLLAMVQILEQLKLLYPNGKISYDQLEQNINDSAIFTPYHWFDALIMGKTKRSMHILQQLKINDVEPLILLRVIQRELILLINLKKHMQSHDLKAAYDIYKVWQNRRNIITPYLNRTDLAQLYQTLQKMAEIEIILKHDYQSPVWQQFDTLNMLFIGQTHG
ncbi:DNA polymerase III subunit delta [Orbus sturtevantii]|uniref:DNA polymerase III subunit delta n=1 Tax=Orbus sturtevantii TaxID=3074109 RepID=UPI00370DDE68